MVSRQIKETASNWVTTAARIVPAGGIEPEAEEAEEEAERADSSPQADSPFTETELAERHSLFRYLKEHRKQKKFEQRLERQDEAREEMRSEMNRVLQEDAERSRESEGTSGGAMIKKAGNGRLGKRKTPADVIHIHGQTYVQDDNDELIPYVPPPPPPPRRFTEQDRKRANKNRDRRHSRIWYTQQLLAVAEGKLILTKEQYHALVTLGRLKGWNRLPPSQR